MISDIPEIGKKYHFFANEKVLDKNHFIAECIAILTFDNVNKGIRNAWDTHIKCSLRYNNNGDSYSKYANYTDYFVVCNIIGFSMSPVIFVRGINNGWYSLNYPYGNLYGFLDVDGNLYNGQVMKGYQYSKNI